MRFISIFLLFLVAVSFLNMNTLGKWFIDEPLKRGETETLYFSIRNGIDKNLEDVNVKLYIYDLGLMYQSPVSASIQKKDHVVERVFADIPLDIEPGEYDALIRVGNNKYKDTKHITIRIA